VQERINWFFDSVINAPAWLLLLLGALCCGVVLIFALRRRSRRQQAHGRIDSLLQELAQRRAELREIELDRSRFLAAFSHDLKQPMQAINLYLGSIERTLSLASLEPAERARSGESLLRLKQGITYMNDVFDSVLDVTRLESGVIEVGSERVPALAFCERLLRQHQRMADDLGLRFELRGSGAETWSLITDPKLLERILRNFISNAMRYTRSGGIRLRVSEQGGLCRIAVIDTGTGIPASLRKKIFDEFTRGESVALSTPGVGLGLSIARRLAGRIGGRIVLRSHLGLGSMFAIDLPMSQAPLTDAEKIVQREHSLLKKVLPQVVVAAPTHTLMLCIDSDPEVSHALSLLAPELGVEILTAASSADGIAQCAAHGRVPAVLLIDAQLQSEPALQAAARLNDEFNTDIPLILCSDDAPLMPASGMLGARITVLQRPFSAERLRLEINRALSSLA
jgi:signal transduction histidine kinase/CheY-like chemotaxis protein